MLGFEKIARKVFGTQNDRELKSIAPIVARINDFEPKIKPLSNEALIAKTAEFKSRYAKGETLDALLPEAFAVVREASVRVLGQRHYDVQMIGGITLHRGRIAEMRTGEGKTLVATLPAYLNAISGKGVHVITVNDYLARRDSEWMGRVHRFLGLEVGVIVHGLTDKQRQQNYAADITYGTNNEFGFDYLRDNMKFRLEDHVQRELNFAIIDEVDSILIDEARTPLIISGPSDDSTDLYYKIDEQIRGGGGLVKDTDYTIDEKSKTAALTESGVDKMEKRLSITNLYDPNNIEVLHHVNQALRAHVIYKRDVDYVVQEGEVQIVDEFTGRLMPGRRWSDGLHQAIEAKEKVTIENENQTLATITFQNFFRMYSKLSGMTGTADTEATEFKQIYKLDVTVIPTNRNMIRIDESDVIYKTELAKFKAISEEIKKRHEKGQPILVGTISIEKSEIISNLLKSLNIPHSVLNAKQHEREADIVAQAGKKGAVTIATNMAGRGTDILLGGNAEFLAKKDLGTLKPDATPDEIVEYEKTEKEGISRWKDKVEKERAEVFAAGGLLIIGTERHESRRIDNQLRGRAGRQGDPGGSRFYLSLDDDLMRIFGGAKIKRFMEDDLPIEHPWINKAVENAQKKVEAHNYDIRKHLLEYDDVMNQQRKVIYSMRKDVLSDTSSKDLIFTMIDEMSDMLGTDFFPNGKLKKNSNGEAHLDMEEVNTAIRTMLSLPASFKESDIVPYNHLGIKNAILKLAKETFDSKEKTFGETNMRQVERMICLTTIDHLWKEHLLAMDGLREGIGLQGYGQKDPLVEYKKEAYRFFEMMMNLITGDVVRKIFAVQIADPRAFEEEFDEPDFEEMNFNVKDDGSLKEARDFSLNSAVKALQGGKAPEQEAARAPNGSEFVSQPQANFRGSAASGISSAPRAAPVAVPVSSSNEPKVGRNDPCPCGSGKKYKKCHGLEE